MMFGCNPDYHKAGNYNSKYNVDLILQASCYNHPARLKGFETIVSPSVKLSNEINCSLDIYGAFWNSELGMKYLKSSTLFRGWHPNEDIPDICKSAKIILGVQCSDISKTQQSMRSFEILASGGFHLTQWVPSMDYWFENNKHLVTVKKSGEAYEKIKFYLSNEKERNFIAESGMKYVRNFHTYTHRIKESILPNL